MVQIYRESRRPDAPPDKPTKKTFSQQLSEGIGKGIDTALFFQRERKKAEFEQDQKKNLAKFIEKEYGRKDEEGNNFEVPTDAPLDFYTLLAKGGMEAKSEREKYEAKQKEKQDLLDQYAGEDKEKREELKKVEEDRINIIRNQFGEDAADLYKSAPEGGKTALIQDFIDRRARGDKFNKQLPEAQVEPEEEEGAPRVRVIDYDRGVTPKERVGRQEKRYAQNLPLHQEAQHKLHAQESANESLAILQELSPKIKSGERFNINPQSGSLIFPALASADAQRFVKTVNDFTVSAKDSFGARVSNFELDRFMQRLPTLANSQEGREMIIKQMQIVNEINMLKNQALMKVFEEYGGIRNVDYDVAEREAERFVKPYITDLKADLRSLDKTLDKKYDKIITSEKKIVPKEHVAVKRADGSTGYIKKEKLNAFLKVPGNKAL